MAKKFTSLEEIHRMARDIKRQPPSACFDEWRVLLQRVCGGGAEQALLIQSCVCLGATGYAFSPEERETIYALFAAVTPAGRKLFVEVTRDAFVRAGFDNTFLDLLEEMLFCAPKQGARYVDALGSPHGYVN